MNVLDENVPEGQRALLRGRRLAMRQIGDDLGRAGMVDKEIISLLLQLPRPTFFTLDVDFYKRRWCHAKYCLVYLDVERAAVAKYVVLLLRHSAFNTRAKRLGCVIRVSPGGLTCWRVRSDEQYRVRWI